MDMWEDDDELNEANDCDPEKERSRVESMPIFQKAEEIKELTRRIIDSIDDERVRMIHMNTMLEDSIVIPERIAAAEALDDYVLKMENATIVKIHARSLENQSVSLLFDGALPKEYLSLLKKEMEAFRGLFVRWVRSFRKADARQDGWGLFYDD
jgi:hypothetical protein